MMCGAGIANEAVRCGHAILDLILAEVSFMLTVVTLRKSFGYTMSFILFG